MTASPGMLSIKELFSVLDLTLPELTAVATATAAQDWVLAGKELLAYYRSRTAVKFGPDPAPRRGHSATDDELRIADNALEHIFITQSSYPPYDFGPNIDWHRNPVADKEWLWQLHRMYWWEPLGKAYCHRADERYATEWAAQFCDWRRKCPPSFEPAWRSLEIGIRAFKFGSWFFYFRDSRAFTPAFLLEFLCAIHDHAVRLAARYSAGSNWGLMESEGLAHIGIIFPEFIQARGWRHTALSRLDTELNAQVYTDGLQRELSFGYHAGCIHWFSRSADLAEKNGLLLPDGYRARIERMYHALAYCLKPNGNIPMFGDSWDVSALETIREGAQRYTRPDLDYIGSLNDATRAGTEPATSSIAFPVSGYYVFRSDWSAQAIWMALKCSSDGGWHSQPDNCSFELFAYGAYLMPDSGCFIYSGDEQSREWFRATAHHQCLTLDEQHSACTPNLLLWQAAGDPSALTPIADVSAVVVQNQSYAELAHRRNVFFVRRQFFIVVDELIGAARGTRRLHFQFGPPPASVQDGSIQVKAGEVGLLFKPFPGASEAEEEPGQVAFQYRRKTARSAYAFNLDEQSVFAATLIPYKGSRAPQIQAQIVGPYQAGDQNLVIDLNIEGEQLRLQRDNKHQEVKLLK